MVFKKKSENNVFNISTYALLAHSFNICRVFLKIIVNISCLAFVDQCVCQILMICSFTTF